MQPPLYDVVHGLALDITNATALEDDEQAAEAYSLLKELCEGQEGTALDHPLQWEALGDFSEGHEEAMQAYNKGLNCSNRLGLSEYSASTKFAMAESYFEQSDIAEAQRLALEARAEMNNDNELSVAISEFLDEVQGR
jgi:hypothetical protein